MTQPHRTARTVGGGAAVLVVLGLVVGAGATGAAAHPFGEPQTITLSADRETVRARWSAPPDDLLLLGGLVGALPDRRTIVLDVQPAGPPEPVGVTDAERLAASPELAAYLAEHVVVRQRDAECPVDVRLDEIVDAGAELVFTCPEVVEEVEVEVTLLTDVHEAYRTVALGDGTAPGRALYTIDDTELTWRFGSAGSPDGGWWLLAALGVGLGAVLFGWYARRRLRVRRLIR